MRQLYMWDLHTQRDHIICQLSKIVSSHRALWGKGNKKCIVRDLCRIFLPLCSHWQLWVHNCAMHFDRLCFVLAYLFAEMCCVEQDGTNACQNCFFILFKQKLNQQWGHFHDLACAKERFPHIFRHGMGWMFYKLIVESFFCIFRYCNYLTKRRGISFFMYLWTPFVCSSCSYTS